jgi:hypothetical protein
MPSFRGAGKAREPGIHNPGQERSLAETVVVMDSGLLASLGAGMTDIWVAMPRISV